MTCPSCGHPVSPGAAFCGSCGARMAPQAAGAPPTYGAGQFPTQGAGAPPTYGAGSFPAQGGAPPSYGSGQFPAQDAGQYSAYGNGSTIGHRIIGTTLPVLEITLQPGQSVLAEAGELSWMSSSIALQTSTQAGSGRGGLFGLLKRAVGGGTLFMTEYRAQGRPGTVAFATKMPGQILPVSVQPGQGYLIHRHGFLCGTPGLELSMAFQRSLGAGVFGGNGFILQRLAGTTQAWIELSGEVIVYDLPPGETLRVHPGHVGMLEERVSFDITMVPGIRNMIFGGDGLFLAVLSGPGRVWLQSLPLPNLAHSLQPYLATGGETPAQSGGMEAAVLRDLFQGQ